MGTGAADAGPAHSAGRRALVRPGADLLPVELRRPARRPRHPRGAALEPEMDRDRGGRRSGRDDADRHSRRQLQLRPINIDTSGRANLVSGGIHLFAQRPVYGYGSGSFPKAYRQHVETRKPRSRSPTPSRSRSPPSRAWSASRSTLALWSPRLAAVGRWRSSRACAAPSRADRVPARPSGGSRHLRRPPRPHHGLRRLLRGPDHLGPARRRASLAWRPRSQRRVSACRDTSAA